MTTIANVGAGTGLGAAIGRRFGTEGFGVALISRNQKKLDQLAEELNGEGFIARGYAASVRGPEAPPRRWSRPAHELGPIEVLEYSPLPQEEFLRPVLETTVTDLAAAVEFSLYGPVAPVHQVLDGMRALGRGTVLVVNGGSAVRPTPSVAGASVGFAGEAVPATMLHDTPGAENIHVGQLVVPGAVEPGHPQNDPGALAQRLWEQHTRRDTFSACLPNRSRPASNPSAPSAGKESQ